MGPHTTSPHAGVSLVELLVVIGIVGVLSAFFMPALMFAAKDRTDRSLRRVIANHITQAKIIEDRYLMELTGSTWSAQPCVNHGADSPQCKVAMDRVFTRIGLDGGVKNPWGFYYFIDENEGQQLWGGGNCERDRVHSYRQTSRRSAMVAVSEFVPLTKLPETRPGRCD